MVNKLIYFLSCTAKRLIRKGNLCPSCGSDSSQRLDRKYLVTELHRCDNCQLMFRIPTTSPDEDRRFYQRAYRSGMTTDMPSADALSTLMDIEFSGSQKNFETYIEILDALQCKPGDKVLDFGCSWGYGSWQLKRRGFDVIGYEISVPRASYARTKLNIEVFTDIEALDQFRDPDQNFDIFFSCHVIEHISSPAEVFSLAMDIVRPGGILVIFTPNGSQSLRDSLPSTWHGFWGRIHPIFLDDIYYNAQFSESHRLLASSPYDVSAITQHAFHNSYLSEHDLRGPELLLVVTKPKSRGSL